MACINCELYKSFVPEFQEIVLKASNTTLKSISLLLSDFAIKLATKCPVCGGSLGTSQPVSVQVEGPTVVPPVSPPSKLDTSSIPVVTKEQYKGDLAYEKIPVGTVLCPVCFGSGKVGEMNGMPVACKYCLNQGFLASEKDMKRVMAYLANKAHTLDTLKNVQKIEGN